MAHDTWINAETPPQGRRTVRRNAHGVLKGYIGRTQWETISGLGISEYSEQEAKAATAWISGREDWHNAAWEDAPQAASV